jgi:hypothetical protein
VVLVAGIEASHSKQESTSCLNLGKKGNRELRRLTCFINYDVNNGNTSHGKIKGRVAGGYI